MSLLKIRMLPFLMLLSLALIAQERVIPLYDGTPAGSEGWDWSEAENTQNGWKTRAVYNVTKPTLTVFTPEPGKANGTSVVICPGGAFRALSIDSEGFDVARWLVKKGVTCFVLKYRLVRSMTTDPVAEMGAKWGSPEFQAESRKLIPLSIADGRAAIRYVRQHVDEWKLDPSRVGIMGFSAGGTVAGSTAFGYTTDDRPAFVAPVYPYFPDEMIGRPASDAPPMFLAAASDDGLDLAPHSIALYNAWLNAKKSVELHMYARGGHGFGMKTQKMPSDQWIDRFGEWLQQQGLLTKSMYDPAMKAYEKKTFTLSEGKVLPYRILYPEGYDRSKKYPVLLFLHGAGERGNDNEKQLIHGAKMFLKPENRAAFPAIVILPQCPENSYWAVIERGKEPGKFSFNYTGAPNWPLEAAQELLKQVIKDESVDPQRVYVTGLSMGGMGTFELVYRNPTLFAAAVPICGGGNMEQYDNRVAETAFRVFHGDKDGVVDVNLSRNMVDRLKQLQVRTVEYKEYSGVNHNSWDNAFAEPDFLTWMMARQRKIPVRKLKKR